MIQNQTIATWHSRAMVAGELVIATVVLSSSSSGSYTSFPSEDDTDADMGVVTMSTIGAGRV